MAVQTATEAPAPKQESAAPSEAPNPAGANGAAPFTAEELAAIEQELGLESAPPAPVKKSVATAEPAAEVRADTESADDAGEQVDGESPESASAGEESQEQGDPESEEDSEWTKFLELAKGDHKKALKLATAYYGEDAEPKGATPPVKAKPFSEEEAVARFYEEAKVEGGEPKALANLVKDLRAANAADIEAARAEARAMAQQEARAAKDVAELAKAYPKTWKQDALAIKAHYATLAAEKVNVEGLPPIMVYRDLLQRRADKAARGESTKAAVAGVTAAKKTAASAAGALPGGRPTGPTERKHVSTQEHELTLGMEFLQRRRALP